MVTVVRLTCRQILWSSVYAQILQERIAFRSACFVVGLELIGRLKCESESRPLRADIAKVSLAEWERGLGELD